MDVRESASEDDDGIDVSGIAPPPASATSATQRQSVAFTEMATSPPQRTAMASSSTSLSPHYAFHTQGFARFPVAMLIWQPLAILAQGVFYGLFWRMKWIARAHFLGDTPIELHLYVAFMFLALVVHVGVSAPMYFHSVTAQMLKRDRDILIVKATAAEVLLCSLPLTVIQLVLVYNTEWPWSHREEDHLASYDGAATGVALASLFSTVMIVWYIYAVYFADSMQRSARIAADEFLHSHSPPRLPGVRMPPTMSMYIAREREENIRAAMQMQRYGFGYGGGAAAAGGATPSRAPLMGGGADGGATPPPQPFSGRF